MVREIYIFRNRETNRALCAQNGINNLGQNWLSGPFRVTRSPKQVFQCPPPPKILMSSEYSLINRNNSSEQWTFTFQHDFAENGRISGWRGAVPLVVDELFLTFRDADLRAPHHGDHDVRMRPTKLAMAPDEARDVITYDASPNQRQGLNWQLT